MANSPFYRAATSGGLPFSSSSMASSSGGGDEPPIPVVPCKDCNGGFIPNTQQGVNCSAVTSGSPVRYDTGEIQYKLNHLSASGFGVSWGHTLSYGNRAQNNALALGPNGRGWYVAELPYIRYSTQGLSLVQSASSNGWFNADHEGGWQGKFGGQGAFSESNPDYMSARDQSGREWRFFNSPGNLYGKLKALVDAQGRVTNLTWDPLTGRISSVSWSRGSRSRSFVYTHVSGGENDGLISTITLLIDSLFVKRVRFRYYETGDMGGGSQTLAEAIKEEWSGGIWKETSRTGYRYYLPWDSNGFEYGLKAIIEPRSMAKLVKDGLDFNTIIDSALLPYADNWFEYDSLHRVAKELVRGGELASRFVYESNPAEPVSSEVNVWNTRTVETLADGSVNRIYMSRAGMPLVKIHENPTTGDQWIKFFEYDDGYNLVKEASPSAIASLTEPDAGGYGPLIVSLKSDGGLIREWSYYTDTHPTAGHVESMREKEQVRQGASGAAQVLRKWLYDIVTVEGYSTYPVRESVEYPDADSTSIAYTTRFEREYHVNEDEEPTFQIKELITTPPVVSTTQHGTGLEEPTGSWYDEDGDLTWERNGRGYLTFHAYDEATGAEIQTIQDVDTAVLPCPAGWTTPPGGGKHLITDYQVDNQGRTLRTLSPWIGIDPATVGRTETEALLVRPVSYTLYRDVEHQRWNAGGFKTGEGVEESWHLTGPVSLTLMDAAGETTDEIQATPVNTDAALNADTFGTEGELPPRSLWTRWTHLELDPWGRLGQTRVYHDIPSSGDGVNLVNYNQSSQIYDLMNRPIWFLSPSETHTMLVLDTRGQVTSRWVGTSSAGATPEDPSGGGNPANNMKPVWRGEYDGGTDGGDGNLTKETLPVDDTTGNDRIIHLDYDFRSREIETQTGDGTDFFYTTTEYDNLNLATASSRYHTSVTTANRTHHLTSDYDARGRRYQTLMYYVNNGGSLGDALNSGSCYDANGRIIKQTGAGQKAVVKTVFDSLNRIIHRYIVSEDTALAEVCTNDVSEDVVIEQQDTHYNDADQIVATTSRSRFDDATGKGALQGADGSQPKSRDSHVTTYADPVGRLRFKANFGTNGGAAFTRPALHPASSDTILVSELRYAADGGVRDSLNPLGIITRHTRDAAGRQTKLEEGGELTFSGVAFSRTNYSSYEPDGGLKQLILDNPETGTQITTWTYGTRLDNSALATNNLPVRKTYPTGEYEIQTYNRQSEVSSLVDANGSVHTYTYDKLGRLLHDAVPTLAGDVDGSVRRLSTSYDLRGRVATRSSYSAAALGSGAVVNQVAFAYNGLDCLTADRQSHSGAVTSGTPEVGYTCTAGANGVLRRTSVVYPNGRTVGYKYGSSYSISDVLNRVHSIWDENDLTVLGEFDYLGAAMPSVSTYPEPGIERRWKKSSGQPDGDAGDPYTGYDRFGRVEKMRWLKGSSALVDITWGYDKASRKTWRKDRLAPVIAEQDQHFNYDSVSQVTGRQRGLLNINHTAIGGIPIQTESFQYDETGNWITYETTEDGVSDVDQSRISNTSNQLVELTGNGYASPGTCGYDANGNLIMLVLNEENVFLEWDAWNRLRKVKNDILQDKAVYQYDPIGRRITTETNPENRRYFYSDNWRCVQEFYAEYESPSQMERQYIWHPADRWELILRDRWNHDEEFFDRHYCLKDELDPVAVCSASGVVFERYAYTTFGEPLILTADYQSKVGNVSGIDWNLLFHTEFKDFVTGWQNYGYRYYTAGLGTWLSRDPIVENGGLNLYRFAKNNPVSNVDVLGLHDKGGKVDFNALINCVSNIVKDARDCKDGIERLLTEFPDLVEDCKKAWDFVKTASTWQDTLKKILDEEIEKMINELQDGRVQIRNNFQLSTFTGIVAERKTLLKFQIKFFREINALDRCTCVRACVKLRKSMRKCLKITD